MQSGRIIFSVIILLLTGITSFPLPKAGATADTIVIHFDETRRGLTCLDPSDTGTGAFSVIEVIHVTIDPQGRLRRVATATEEFTYVTSDGATFWGHQEFHSTVMSQPDALALMRIVIFSGRAQGSDGSLTVWRGLSVSVDGTVLQDRFECESS